MCPGLAVVQPWSIFTINLEVFVFRYYQQHKSSKLWPSKYPPEHHALILKTDPVKVRAYMILVRNLILCVHIIKMQWSVCFVRGLVSVNGVVTLPCSWVKFTYRETSNISCTLVGNKFVDDSDVVGAWPVSDAQTYYIFIINITLGFNGLHKDNCMTRQETYKCYDLVGLTLEV